MRTPRLGLILPDPPIQSLPRLVETLWRAFLRLDDAASGTVTLDGVETLSNKTLVAPTIASFVNAQHDHQDADDGGTLTHTALVVPRVHVNKNVVQSVPNGTDTAITFDQEVFDVGGLHDNAVNNTRLTATTAGVYQITARVNYASNATGFRRAYVLLNAGPSIVEDHRNAVNGLSTIASLTILRDMALNDFVELFIFQNSGGALDVGADFQMVRVA